VRFRHYHWDCTTVPQKARFQTNDLKKFLGITEQEWETVQADIKAACEQPITASTEEGTDNIGKLLKRKRKAIVKKGGNLAGAINMSLGHKTAGKEQEKEV
jgi:hypothetical protein